MSNLTLSGATTPGQCGPGSNGNKGVLHIPQSSSITGTSSSDCLVSCSGHLLGVGSYSSAEKQFVYSTAPAGWAIAGERIDGLMSFQRALAWSEMQTGSLEFEVNVSLAEICWFLLDKALSTIIKFLGIFLSS